MSTDGEDIPKRDKIKRHLKENKKTYLAAVGGVAVGASVTTVMIFHRFGGFPVEISQTAKNTALIVWKPQNTNITLVKRCCPDPIPVLDKDTGETYASLRRAAEMTKMAYEVVRKDANGAQERFERLPDSVFA